MSRLSNSARTQILDLALDVLGGSRPVSRSQQMRIINQVLGTGGRARYAGGTRGGGVLAKLFKALAGIAGGNATEADLINAARLLRESGFLITPGGDITPPPVQPRSRVVVPPAPPVQDPWAPAPPISYPDRRRLPRGPGQVGAPPLPGEESSFGEEILTPQSSNVFAFSYQRDSGAATGTLYVTYKAPQLNADSVHRGKGRRGGREQLRGQRGSTISGKTNERGPLYAYFEVPPRLFGRMRSASSKGKFVWDELRVRGTIYGHKFRYQLVQGAVITQKGVSGTYVPRKATPKGFRVRSVANVGQPGRRGYESSTLPGQTGFSTRRRR